jgi:3-oxoacyl-[acyl-carrier protein] reductase
MPQLVGRKAIVTGGSRGIGAGIVRSLAEDGADIGFTYLKDRGAAEALLDEVESSGRRAAALQADSSDPQALTKAVDRLADKLTGLDIFVSSAGALMFKPVDQFSVEEFDKIVSLDLRAAFVGSQAALKHFGSSGRIIFISSNIADYAALPTTASTAW